MKIPSLILALSLFHFSNSVSSQSSEIPEDFYFIIDDAEDDYDSRTGTFIRMYAGGSKEAHNVQLTAEEKEKIYQYFDEYRFLELPVDYRPTGDTVTITEPGFSYNLTSNYGGKLKRVHYYSGITDENTQAQVKPYMDLYMSIWEVIYAKPEVKRIKESNIGWE